MLHSRHAPILSSSNARSGLPSNLNGQHHLASRAFTARRCRHYERARMATANMASTDATISTQQPADRKSADYSKEMQRKMGTSLTYNHAAGIDYNRILPDIIVGSCLQTPEDVDRLVEQEGVTTIFNLQEDSDMAYFNLDVNPIRQRCKERGDIKHVRFPVRDFDPFDLRRKLPKAVAQLSKVHDPSKGVVYIHCTAGMGRAPATALAYMNWIRGLKLDEAYEDLTSKRRCSPKIDAIRSATADLLLGTQPVQVVVGIHRFGAAKRVQIAGLDVGWHKPLDTTWDASKRRFELRRELFPGTYQYKLIVDGHWTYSADHPTANDSGNINNVLEVIAPISDPHRKEAQSRILSKGNSLTPREQEELRALLCPWNTHNSQAAAGTAPIEACNLDIVG